MGAAPTLSAAPILQSKGYTIPGVIILDVVEGLPLSLSFGTERHSAEGETGTAIEALPIMKSILAQRPSSFRSIPDAIHWQYVPFYPPGYTLLYSDNGCAPASTPIRYGIQRQQEYQSLPFSVPLRMNGISVHIRSKSGGLICSLWNLTGQVGPALSDTI